MADVEAAEHEKHQHPKDQELLHVAFREANYEQRHRCDAEQLHAPLESLHLDTVEALVTAGRRMISEVPRTVSAAQRVATGDMGQSGLRAGSQSPMKRT